MAHFHYLDKDNRIVSRMVVWNWKTGEPVRFRDLSGHVLLNLAQVLDLSSTDRGELVKSSARVAFLDEFHLAVIPDVWAITELAVFNTLIPQDHPGYLQRLTFPPEFCNKSAKIHVDGDRDLGTPNQDEALLPDPAQMVLVIDLQQDRDIRIFLVVRTQVLVEQVHSVRIDCRVPWDEWGRDTVAIYAHGPEGGYRSPVFVHGAQVMIAWSSLHHFPDECHVHTFDFSQRGRGFLPLQSGADGTGRRAKFEDGVHLRLEQDLVVRLFDVLRSFSDGSLIRLVGCLAHHVGSGAVG